MKFIQGKEPLPKGHEADENGIVAVGGEISAQRLKEAYALGIFPWPHEGLPILWFCPDPRFVLRPKEIKVNHSLKKAFKKSSLSIKADINFLAVMKYCQLSRPGQHGTWITKDIIEGYYQLHKLGFAHSIEAYDDDKLVGGLYGVSLGRVFFGESMFFLKPDASKICFLTLVAHLIHWDFSLIDCQAQTDHLERFGAKPIARDQFLEILDPLVRLPHKTKWHLHLSKEEILREIHGWPRPTGSP